MAAYNGNNGAGVRWSMGSGHVKREQWRRCAVEYGEWPATMETKAPVPPVAASVAAVGAADVLPRRAHNEQQEKHEFTS